jgi:putative PIN family toxin of toxin-antitoxin system
MKPEPRKGRKSSQGRVPRVVLDTNCLVSALLFKNGRLAELRSAWQTERFIPLACRETVTELVRVLGYPKFRLDKDDVEALLGDFLPWVETFDVKKPDAPVPGLRDSQDAVFIHLTRQAGADLLVSGDVHILSLKNDLMDIRSLPPGEFLSLSCDPDQTGTLREIKP